MATQTGNWIKMRVDLQSHPKVVRIASALNADKKGATKRERMAVVGALHAVWSVFDAHSVGGNLDGYSCETMDEEIGWPGFTAAMVAAEWLVETVHGLQAPEYEEHNGTTAKRRAQETQRKRNERASGETELGPPVCDSGACNADKLRTREEKRRSNTPLTPQRGKAAGSVALATWLDAARAKGEKPIPEGDPVFAYASSVGIPEEFLHLAWQEFRHRYLQSDAKRYKDWRAVFRKAVRGNWLKLWWLDGDTYTLTTVGQQAKRAHAEKAA